MAGGLDIRGLLGRPRRSSFLRDRLFDILSPPPAIPFGDEGTEKSNVSDILDQKIDLNTITPEQGAALTSQLEQAQTDTGFSGVQEVFDVLDIPGAFVRGLVGAGVSAAKGEFGQAGERLLSALPGSENIPKLLTAHGVKMPDWLGPNGVRAPEGSDLLEDFGWEKGTTTDDEWRMRIARAAGASDVTQFVTKGKPLAFEQQREFDALLKKAGDILPADQLGPNFEDAKKATDAQDFAGIAVEIALDPLTYFTFGASAAGKVARLAATAEKAGGKGLLAALKGADTLADARKVIQAIDVPGFGPRAKQTLLGSLDDAFRAGKPDFDLGRTLAEQSGRGQLQAGFKLPFAKEPFLNVPTKGAADVLSTLGQSKLAESVFGDVPIGVNEKVHSFMTETPVVAQVTGILRGVIEGGRKLAGRTGLPELGELIKSGKAMAGEGIAAGTRELNKLNAAMRDTAKAAGVDLDVVRATVGEAVELSKPLERAREQVAALSRVGDEQAQTLDGLLAKKAAEPRGSALAPTPKTKAADPVAAKANTKTWYHGTGQSLSADTLDASRSDPAGLYGPGIYLTDTPKVARGYAKARGRKDAGKVYEMRVGLERVLDAELPIADQIGVTPKAIEDLFLDQLTAALRHLDSDFGLEIRRAMDELFEKGWRGTESGAEAKLVADIIKRELGKVPAKATWEDYLTVFKRFFSEHPRASAIPSITDRQAIEYYRESMAELNRFLMENGVEALRHTGGKHVGKVDHEVIILLDPNASTWSGPQLIRKTEFPLFREAETALVPVVSVNDISAAQQRLAATKQALSKAQDDAARLAASFSRTGLKESEIAPIAAGFTKINEMLAKKADQFNLPLNELDDESLNYLHRMLTGPGREWVRKNSKKVKDLSGGAEFSAFSGMFKGRIDKWRGKTIKQINEEMSKVMDGAKFFTEDPFAATTHAVHEMHRRIGNAYTATKIVEQFGSEAVTGSDFTAAKLYEKIGLRMADDEAEKLAKIAVPEELFDATVNALETQKSPGKFLSFYHGVTNWLKATVTTLFPAFHGRNMLENTFKGFIEGNRDPRNLKDAVLILAAAQDLNAGGAGFFDAMARGARSTFAKAGKPSDEVMKLLKEETGFANLEDFAAWASGNGLFENKFTSEFGVDMRLAMLGTDQTTAQKAAAGFRGLLGAPQRAGFALASGTENMHRLSFFLDKLRKGAGREGALNEVKRVFFDYRDMGKLESTLSKNLGFFYNFYRNNARYLVQTAANHPQYTKQISRLFADDPDNPRHSWLSDKGTFRVGGVDVALGFLPQQQFNMFDLSEGDLWDKMQGKLGQGVGQMNPLIEQGLSMAFGKDLYRNLPLEYVDRAPDWSFAPDWIKTMIGLRETVGGGYVMSPKWRWAMDTIPAMGRFAQSQISLESDRAYWSTMAQLLSGVRIQDREPTKDALALLQRNIDRSADGMDDLRRGAFGEWVTDRRTSEGRIKAALTKQSPDKQDLVFLASEPKVMARLAPYVTLDKDGQPVMNRLLRTKMLELGTELYPRHAALMQAQQAQRAAQIRAMSPKEQEAQAAFEAMFGG